MSENFLDKLNEENSQQLSLEFDVNIESHSRYFNDTWDIKEKVMDAYTFVTNKLEASTKGKYGLIGLYDVIKQFNKMLDDLASELSKIKHELATEIAVTMTDIGVKSVKLDGIGTVSTKVEHFPSLKESVKLDRALDPKFTVEVNDGHVCVIHNDMEEFCVTGVNKRIAAFIANALNIMSSQNPEVVEHLSDIMKPTIHAQSLKAYYKDILDQSSTFDPYDIPPSLKEKVIFFGKAIEDFTKLSISIRTK